jgi:hypothetical protein
LSEGPECDPSSKDESMLARRDRSSDIGFKRRKEIKTSAKKGCQQKCEEANIC